MPSLCVAAFGSAPRLMSSEIMRASPASAASINNVMPGALA
jgi:hypothetical protein